jgi:hypothetical protein
MPFWAFLMKILCKKWCNFVRISSLWMNNLWSIRHAHASMHTHSTSNRCSGSFKFISCCNMNQQKIKVWCLNFLAGVWVQRKCVISWAWVCVMKAVQEVEWVFVILCVQFCLFPLLKHFFCIFCNALVCTSVFYFSFQIHYQWVLRKL